MASSLFNRVQFTPTAGGTADFVVSAAVAGYDTPATRGVANGSTVSYTAESSDKSQWETGTGTYTSGTVTVSRTTIRESSTGGTKVNFSSAPTVWLDAHAQDIPSANVIEYVIDGGGVVLSTGIKGYLEIPYAATITQATLLADQSGSVVVNIYKCTYANFDAGSTHPVAADKITAAAPPTITTATKSQDSTLTGWTTAITAGDILAFNIDSATTITRVTISLKVTR